MIVFPDPAKKSEIIKQWKKDVKEGHARRPFTHKTEPVDFHWANVMPWVNHVAVPL